MDEHIAKLTIYRMSSDRKMRAGILKWLLGILTSIVVGLAMWWLTHYFLARPELRVLETQVSGSDPLVIRVTVFNSGEKLADSCYLDVEFYIDDRKSLLPSNYSDLKKFKLFGVASSRSFFIAPSKRQEVAVAYHLPKGYRGDLPVIHEGYTDLTLWLGIRIKCQQGSTRAFTNMAVVIYAPPGESRVTS